MTQMCLDCQWCMARRRLEREKAAAAAVGLGLVVVGLMMMRMRLTTTNTSGGNLDDMRRLIRKFKILTRAMIQAACCFRSLLLSALSFLFCSVSVGSELPLLRRQFSVVEDDRSLGVTETWQSLTMKIKSWMYLSLRVDNAAQVYLSISYIILWLGGNRGYRGGSPTAIQA